MRPDAARSCARSVRGAMPPPSERLSRRSFGPCLAAEPRSRRWGQPRLGADGAVPAARFLLAARCPRTEAAVPHAARSPRAGRWRLSTAASRRSREALLWHAAIIPERRLLSGTARRCAAAVCKGRNRRAASHGAVPALQAAR